MKTGGFTLVELLTVIAVVGIVSALLLAALGRGRDASSAAQCVQNIHQLAAANVLYARENEGRFCFAQDKRNNLRWHGERGSALQPFDGTKGPLAPYLGRESRVKICPAFERILRGSKSFENGSGGYGYNAIYIGGTPANPWDGELLANVPAPANTVMFADTALTKAGGVQEYPFAEPPRWVTPSGKLAGTMSPSVHFRHSGRANVAWCDGHVTAEAPSRLGTKNYYGGDDKKEGIGWFGPERDNGYWNPAFDVTAGR
jgi:prepilin-type processing-associated H-X9-DG protein/prepilin-type N-terminal cleavage/methylation domain-containing protein